MTKKPSEFVFPDDEMIFEFKVENLGVGSESLFNLYPQLIDNEGNLEITVDEGYFSVRKDVPVYKTLTIRKGPRMYINKPIDLTFESACMDDASL